MSDSQINRNGMRKKVYCSKLLLLQSFYCLRWNMLLTGDAYLINNTLLYYPEPCLNLFTCYSIAYEYILLVECAFTNQVVVGLSPVAVI